MTSDDLKYIREIILVALDEKAIRDDNREEFVHIVRYLTNDIHTYKLVKENIYCKRDGRCRKR